MKNRTTTGTVVRWFLYVVVALAFLFALLPLFRPSSALPAEDPPARSIPACLAEDAARNPAFPCHWDADTRGDGKGSDFIAFAPNNPEDDPVIVRFDD